VGATPVTELERELRAAVAANPLWYHTMELAPGVVTPGWFDLRPIVERLPWPDVRGKRCLDVGTYDGFLAFELERRGAAEVVATDIGAHEQWDWAAPERAAGTAYLRWVAGEDKARGFETARRALGSSVERVELSVYELSPERLGQFDVVVCGSLLLHLRNPVDALEAIRSVCAGAFLSAEQVSLSLTLLQPRRPAARLRPREMQWWVPNSAAHGELLRAGGFQVERRSGFYAIPFGRSHPPLGHGPRALAWRALVRLVAGGVGVPHRALLARPAR
jgi:tRNA (mo5U34)-methyltransferase